MGIARVFSAAAACAAVTGCAVVAVGMSSTGGRPDSALQTRIASGPTSNPGFASVSAAPTDSLGVERPAATSGSSPGTTLPSTGAQGSGTGSTATNGAGPSYAAPGNGRPAAGGQGAGAGAQGAPAPVAAAPQPAYHPPAPAPGPARGQALPLGFGTGNATQVITVTAGWAGSTTATLQAWTKAPGGGWFRYGGGIPAHIGADGMSSQPSEWRSATPIGSFTLTQAFGHNSNPGTGLPYFQTDGADWWISQSGALYNTHQHCWSNCGFNQGNPNEHLYYETPYYNYAVVIDYNTRNAPGGVHQGAGSAFFLHVTDGSATAGCVAIPQSNLVPLMRWLRASNNPRILIGIH